jgi:3-oxoadipate enol-lactonase
VEAAGPADSSAVLFLHAGIADSRMWDAEFAALQATHRVVRIDLRGYGRSSVPNGPFSYHGDVVAALDSLGIERATLVGCSFGGSVALDVAVSYPERVAGLVLVAPSIGTGGESPEIRAFGEREEAAIERGDLDGATEENLRFWVDGPHRGPDQVDPKLRAFVGAMQRAAFDIPMPDGAKAAKPEPPVRDRLGDIKTRTLVLIGSLDVAHVQGVARRVAAEVPGARLQVMEGTGHLPSLEKPGPWLETLRGFLVR